MPAIKRAKSTRYSSRVTDEDLRARVVELSDGGATQRGIAKALGVSRGRVRRIQDLHRAAQGGPKGRALAVCRGATTLRQWG